MKTVTKYWSVNFVTGFDRKTNYYIRYSFIIDYLTGEIIDQSTIQDFLI